MTKTRDWLLDAVIEEAIARKGLGDQLGVAHRDLLAEQVMHGETKRVLVVTREKRKRTEKANARLCDQVRALGKEIREVRAEIRAANAKVNELQAYITGHAMEAAQ